MGQKHTVPYLDLKLQHEGLHGEIGTALQGTINKADFILGSAVGQFEEGFARYCECEYAVGVSSGTAALHLSLLALGVGPGDEVITVPNSFVATIEAILYTGATPVLVDVDAETFTMDPGEFTSAITSRTRAVIPVHMYGQPCDIESIVDIATQHGIAVLEDACQAHGARSGGARVGSFGAAAAFSFYPTKNLGAFGDGGAVTTNDAKLAERIRALRHHGQYQPNEFREVGFNSRLDSIQAAVLNVKLPHLDAWNEQRRKIAARYQSVKSEEYRFQRRLPESEPVYHILAVRHPRRSAVIELLDAAGIGWGRHIVPPAHKHAAYRELAPVEGRLAVSEQLSRELISLPVYPGLAEEQVDYVREVMAKVEVSV